MAQIRMFKGQRGPALVPFTYDGFLVEEIPPAVRAARIALGWSADEVDKKTPPNEARVRIPDRAAPATPGPAPGTPQPCLQGHTLVTAAGEVLRRKKTRAMATRCECEKADEGVS